MIVLTTLNARYHHTSIGLRYLYANMRELQAESRILEFTAGEAVQPVAESILSHSPAIVGIGAYIWNALDVQELLRIIKKVSPKTVVIIGGAEASHLPFRVDFTAADFILQGEADTAFYELCRQILSGCAPEERIIKADAPNLLEIALPYDYYDEHDVKYRAVYVEASRGCAFSCEFCLSSIDRKVRAFDLELFLQNMEKLWQKGVRSFKFVDRTFNLDISTANRLLDFFLSKQPPYFAHFEVIPDHFPQELKSRLEAFPPNSLQLEIGIQTLNEEVSAGIKRKLNIPKIKENIAFLQEHTSAHLHLDLIVGLPGESVEGFGQNLNELCRLSCGEIQVGILKKLSGTSLDRHDTRYGMVYSDTPPYDILQNDLIPFELMQKMKRFARFWDLVYNSGNFVQTVKLLWEEDDIFHPFYALSREIYEKAQVTAQISLERMALFVFEYLTKTRKLDRNAVAQTMIADVMKIQGRTLPAFLREYENRKVVKQNRVDAALKRQQKRVNE